MMDIKKIDTLAKLMEMTTSKNDAEAINAMRKANQLLKNEKTDWSNFIKSKIEITIETMTPEITQRVKQTPMYEPVYVYMEKKEKTKEKTLESKAEEIIRKIIKTLDKLDKYLSH